MELHEKLHQLRKEKGLTQAEVAEILDVSRQSVSNWESGASMPSTNRLKALSTLYRVHLDCLLNDEDELPSIHSNAHKMVILNEGESNGEKSVQCDRIKGGEKRIMPKGRKKGAIILLVLCVIIVIGSCASFIWWSNQPSQIFPFWGEEPSNEPERNGVDLDIFVVRNEDGSGTIEYIFTNDTNVEKTWEIGAWLDYYYKGEFHGVTGPYYVPLGKKYYLSPGEAFSQVLELPPKTLSKSGRYRFCARDVGWKDLVLFDDGSIIVGE
mgnify:FL=1|jgi:transcriptional regulator with XRE-family HTH domain